MNHIRATSSAKLKSTSVVYLSSALCVYTSMLGLHVRPNEDDR